MSDMENLRRVYQELYNKHSQHFPHLKFAKMIDDFKSWVDNESEWSFATLNDDELLEVLVEYIYESARNRLNTFKNSG